MCEFIVTCCYICTYLVTCGDSCIYCCRPAANFDSDEVIVDCDSKRYYRSAIQMRNVVANYEFDGISENRMYEIIYSRFIDINIYFQNGDIFNIKMVHRYRSIMVRYLETKKVCLAFLSMDPKVIINVILVT